MDATVASSRFAAIVGQVQSAVVGKMLATDQASGGLASGGSAQAGSAINLVDAAQQNIDSLVNASAGLGTYVDLRV
jgi:hypothetical protein